VEGVFGLAVRVLQKVCARPGVLEQLAVERTLVKLKGVYRVLYTRLQKEGLYMSKLENQKGSDASACNATRRLIQTSEQLKALKQLIKPLHAAALASLDGNRHMHANHADALAGAPCSDRLEMWRHDHAFINHAGWDESLHTAWQPSMLLLSLWSHASQGELPAELPQPAPGDWIHEITKGGSKWVPKNTKVRATFREVLHNVHGFELPEVSEEHPATAKRCSDGAQVHDTADSHALRPVGQIAHHYSTRKAAFGSLIPAASKQCSENVAPASNTPR
jgi:hypothetical protein